MKTVSFVTSVIAALTMALLPARATTYTGTGTANGGGAADGGAINSVVVGNDSSTITFTVNSTLPMASYVFYTIQLQVIGAPVGDTSLLNPWGEHIGASTGLNALINTYGSGATPGTFGGGVWTMGSGAGYAAGGTGSSFFTVTESLSSLSLSVGQSFYFDVVSSYASPGGQSAYGALDSIGGFPAENNSSYKPWQGPTDPNFYDSATDASGTKFGTAASMYTVVPEPATCALLGLGSLLMIMRRRVFSTR
jgi:hypothetical protein